MGKYAKPFVPAKEVKLGADGPSPPAVNNLGPNAVLAAYLLMVAFTHVSAHITSLSKPENDACEVSYQVSVPLRTGFEEILNHKHKFKLRILEEGCSYVDNGKKYDLFGYLCARE
jgi:hypothetical protein